jgi:1-deoxy-D-xylulose-5-phosphate reductoisomerase
MQERLAILGSTGSIGTQTLDVAERYPEHFRVEVLIAGNNTDLLARQAKKFKPSLVIISNENQYKKLKDELSGTRTEVCSGPEAIEQAAASSDVDTVVASIVGYSGLRPTVSAVRAGKKIALANKETLVVAGEIIGELAAGSGSKILPVDSEHSAIFQCLTGEKLSEVEKITLTASGGAFLNFTLEELARVKPAEALRHPNWDMGCKVTIDSASLMNKGLEVIEARWLFDLDPSQISVIIHPQSVIHSLVHFRDGSVKAQLGVPDMRVPILYALSYPDRLGSDLPRLNFTDYPSLTFQQPDLQRFQNLSLAFDALNAGGNMCCVLNAANEIAVNAFLSEMIGFLQMPDVVKYTMESGLFIPQPSLEDLEQTDKLARDIAASYIDKICN